MSWSGAFPWPPSVNHYKAPAKRRGGVRLMTTERVRLYRQLCAIAMLHNHQKIANPLTARLVARLIFHANSARKYDLDNFTKGVLDALMQCAVIVDDSQIDVLHLERGKIIEGPGAVQITLQEF